MNHFNIDEMQVGMTESFSVEITSAMMEAFHAITGDDNPLHLDKEYALKNGQKDVVCYGLLTTSLLSTLAGVYLPGERSLIHKVEAKYPNPVYVGDKLTVQGMVEEVNQRYGYIILKCEIINQDSLCVLRGKMQIGVRS